MNRSHLQGFFIELAVVLLFFSFSAAIDLRLFAEGSRLSRESQEVNRAVLAAQDLAENIAAGDPITDGTQVYYDQEWQKTNAPASFMAEISVAAESVETGQLAYYTIAVSAPDGRELYRLQTAKYWPEG